VGQIKGEMSKMRITRKLEIDYGHRVPNHKSKCFSPHGHRGVIYLHVEGDVIEEEGDHQQGMVVDFSDIKKALMATADHFMDHAFLIYENDPFKNLLQGWDYGLQKEEGRKFKVLVLNYIPTAENISCHIFRMVEEYFKINKAGFRVAQVDFQETPNSIAIATHDDAHAREFIGRVL
jgi:6-pyruvoyltetrahydropterin/6-carboxytetrahydropterin synthase